MSRHPILQSNICKHGDFTSLKNDLYISRSLAVYGQWCEAEARLFQQILRPGDIAVDAGANIGAFTVPMAKAVGDQGRVYAFEPQSFLAALMAKNVIQNGHANVRPFVMGLSDCTGMIQMDELDYSTHGNYGGLSFFGDEVGAMATKGNLSIPFGRLDDIIAPNRLRLIKIDIEGMELQCLNGARSLIEAFRPFLYIESGKNHDSQALVDFAKDYEYQTFWHESWFFDAKNWAGVSENLFGSTSGVHLFCAPKGAKVSGFAVATGASDHPRNVKRK